MATMSPPEQTTRSPRLLPAHPVPYGPTDQSSRSTPPRSLPSAYLSDVKATPQQKVMASCHFCQIRNMSCSGIDSIKDGRCNNCSWYDQKCSFIPALLQTPASLPRDYSSPYPKNSSTYGNPAVMAQQRQSTNNTQKEGTGEGSGNTVSPKPVVSTPGVAQSHNTPIQDPQQLPQMTQTSESKLEKRNNIVHHTFVLSSEGLPLQRTQRSTPEVSQSHNVPAQIPQQLAQVAQDKEAELEKRHEISTPGAALASNPNVEPSRSSSPGMKVTLSFSGFKQLLSKDLNVSGEAMERFLAELQQIPDYTTKYLVCRNTGYELSKATKPNGRTMRFFEVVKEIPGFSLHCGQDELLWKHLKGSSKGPSSEKEKESAKARIRRNWGDRVLQKLTPISTGTSMLSSCASMSRKPWAVAQHRVQRAAYQRLASRPKGSRRLVFICGDFLDAVKMPDDRPPPTTSDFEKIGCRIDEDGFLVPLLPVRSNKRSGKDGIEPPTKKIRIKDEGHGHTQTVSNDTTQMATPSSQYSPAGPSEGPAMKTPGDTLGHVAVRATTATNPPEQYQNEDEHAVVGATIATNPSEPYQNENEHAVVGATIATNLQEQYQDKNEHAAVEATTATNPSEQYQNEDGHAIVGATIAANPPDQYQNENEHAAVGESVAPPEHNFMNLREPNELLSSGIDAPMTDSGQAEVGENPSGHTEATDSHSSKECECISNIGWDYFSLLVAAIKGGYEDLYVLMNKLSSMRDTLSLCTLHLHELASRLDLHTNITGKELAYRIRQSLIEPDRLTQMMAAPGTGHWFKGGEKTMETAAPNGAPSNLWEQGSHKLDKKGFLKRLNMILADFCDLRTAWSDFAQQGFASIPGILQTWMHRGAKDQLSIYEIALREAWVYNHHTSRPHDSAMISTLQFGVVQQALRSNLLLYILLLALRNDGEHRLFAYPTPAEFPMPKGGQDVLTFFESPVKQYNLSMERNNSLVHCEVIVKPPGKTEEKIAAFPEKADAITSTDWWRCLKEEKIVSLNSDRALPLQLGLEALRWDRKNADIVESGRFSASFFHPCAPQIRPAVTTPVLRFPIVMSSKRQGATVDAFEKDAYGEIPGALRANTKLTPVSTLPDGRRLQGQITASRIPSTKYRPPSAIGNALVGFMEWGDPKVVLELRRLFYGPISEAQELIRNDLDASAAEIRESWEAFSQAEIRASGPFSGLVVLQGLLKAKRVDSAGDLPVENEDQEYQGIVEFLRSAEGRRVLDPVPDLPGESGLVPMEMN